MNQFIVLSDQYTNGFFEHVDLRLTEPISSQLRRVVLLKRASTDSSNAAGIRRIITNNSSLRINFGWSFECPSYFTKVVDDSLDKVNQNDILPKNLMITDMRCSWLGFEKYNIFEQAIYEDLSVDHLIILNNELVRIQTEIIENIISHPIFLQHAITRDSKYRFQYFKNLRNDPDKLHDAFYHFLDSSLSIASISAIPRDFIEHDVGCHFLNYPDLFFELLNFGILKGTIYG